MIHALRRPAIARLWLGQSLSAIGDQIYYVGFTWLAVGLIGADAGYLNASHAAALMLMSLVGGHWADRWPALKTMIAADVVRASLVLIPVFWSFFAPVSLPVLWVMTVLLACASAFFEPSLNSFLPRLARDRELLGSATGLMSTSFRMARMIGPTLVGLLSSVIPMIHFFTVDAVSFLISAFCLRSIPKIDPQSVKEDDEPKSPRGSIWATIRSGWECVGSRQGMLGLFLVRALVGGGWGIVMGLGVALLVKEMTGSTDARQFGLVIGSYGLGNFLGALFFGNRKRRNSKAMVFGGYTWLGAMFVVMGLVPSIPLMMVAASFAGFSGPMNDLGFIDIIQSRFTSHELMRVTRFRLVSETGVSLLCMTISPTLFRLFSVHHVIVTCGLLYIVCGVIGFLKKDALREA